MSFLIKSFYLLTTFPMKQYIPHVDDLIQCLGFCFFKGQRCEHHCSINYLTIISQSISIRRGINRWHNRIFKNFKTPANRCVAAQHHLLSTWWKNVVKREGVKRGERKRWEGMRRLEEKGKRKRKRKKRGKKEKTLDFH